MGDATRFAHVTPTKKEELPFPIGSNTATVSKHILFAAQFHGTWSRAMQTGFRHCLGFRDEGSEELLDVWFVFNKYYSIGYLMKFRVNMSQDGLMQARV